MFKLIFMFAMTGNQFSQEYAHSLLFERKSQCESHVSNELSERFKEFGDSHHGDLLEIIYLCKRIDIT